MKNNWNEQKLMQAFRMPSATKITFRTSTITAAFALAITPLHAPKPSEIAEVLSILEIDPNNLLCAYCGDPATEWEHLRPIVKERRPTGYPSSIRNLVPSCGKCNQSKGGKEWRDWITSGAPRSPKSRNVPDLTIRISRLENYEKWAKCTPLSIATIIGEKAYNEYFDKLTNIIEQMKEAQKFADFLRQKVTGG